MENGTRMICIVVLQGHISSKEIQEIPELALQKPEPET